MATTLRVVGKSDIDENDVSVDAQVSEAELEKAENELRQEARSLIREIEHKYWDLGRVLYDVYDGVPGGFRALMKGKGSAKARVELFKKWGYTSFEQWVETEVGLRKRTAQNIRYMYYYFEIQQKMPRDIIEKLIPIGRSKLYLLAGVATLSNVTFWIEKAHSLTFEGLKQAIADHKAVLAQEGQDDEEKDQGAGAEPSAADSKKPESKSLPKPEEMTTFQAGLFEGQKKTVDMAFERAQNLSKSDKKGHNLDLICQDYLANNGFDDPKKDIEKYLSKMSKKLGLLLIAIDPQTGEPVYNQDLLWRMMEEKAKADE